MAGTYGDMVSRIADELGMRTDLTSQIKLAIQSAIVHYESERFFFNEQSATLSTVSGTATVTPPSDLIAVDLLQITIGSRPFDLKRRDFATLMARGATDPAFKGQPREYALYNNLIYLLPVPNQVWSLPIYYVRQLGALSADADTNAWMTSGEELIRQRAKADVRINVTQDQAAMQEAQALAMGNEPYLSALERVAARRLRARTSERLATGTVRPTSF